MIRHIRFYNKVDEKLAGEISINIDVNNMQALQEKFNSGNKESDPLLYYCYPINPNDVNIFLQFLDGHKFDFSNFDYFLEY